MNGDLDATVKAAASAVSGPDTPAQIAATSKPDRLLLIAMAGAGPALCVMLGAVIWILGQHDWPASVASDQIKALMWIALSLCGCLAVTVLRLASGQFKRADVKAGPASVSIGSE